MCTNGVNTNQLKASIQQLDEACALTRRWIHRAYHLADDGGQAKSAESLAKAQSLMDEVRALLSDADMDIDENAGSNVTIELA